MAPTQVGKKKRKKKTQNVGYGAEMKYIFTGGGGETWSIRREPAMEGGLEVDGETAKRG